MCSVRRDAFSTAVTEAVSYQRVQRALQRHSIMQRRMLLRAHQWSNPRILCFRSAVNRANQKEFQKPPMLKRHRGFVPEKSQRGATALHEYVDFDKNKPQSRAHALRRFEQEQMEIRKSNAGRRDCREATLKQRSRRTAGQFPHGVKYVHA
jgi:hypothetical protein